MRLPWFLRDPTLRAILLLTMLVGLSTGFVMPFLTLTARDRGVSLDVIGIMASSYLLAQMVLQLPMGALSDRVGRVGPIVAGMLVEAVATAGFAVADSATVFILLRVAQGVGFSLLYPSFRALIADTTPPERRGRSFAMVSAAVGGGLLLGPPIGGVAAGVIGAAQLFLGAAVIEALVAVWALNRFSGIRRIYQARASSAEPVPFSSLLTRPLIGAFLLAFAGQFQTGLFSGIWSIYLADRGASDLTIGLSYSTYSIAFMVLAPFGGRLADRTPRWRKLLVANLLFSLVVASYGVLPSVTLVILMGLAEGAIGAVAQPTLDAYLASVADARVQGRVQGAFATTGMAGAAISAFLGSVLYALGAPVPFAVGGTVLALLTLVAAALIREAEQRRAGGPPGHDQPTQVLAEPGAGYSA